MSNPSPAGAPIMPSMDIGTLRRHDKPVPRYTSYPTAPHFHDGVGERDYADWLGAVGAAERISLYLHVPFCARMCWYCGCHTKVVKRYEPVAGYAGLLRREAGLVAGQLREGPSVGHVHWGGGTPTMLSAADFAALMDGLRDRFSFAPDAEVAVEIDPRTLDQAKVAALAGAGVNRASLGVQDLNETVQVAINRIQPYEMTARAVERLRAAGIGAINFDLIYGLPRQGLAEVERTVDLAAGLRPDRLSIFGYAHVPWMKTHQRMIDEAELPGATERLEQAEAAAARLVSHGYRRIGLDHFALPDDAMTRALDEGRLRRNFQGYTDDRAEVLLGLGASSIGALPRGYVQNAVAFKAYGEAVEAGRLPVAKGIALDDDDRLRRAVIEQLMCYLTVDLERVARDHGLPAEGFLEDLDALAPQARDGLVRLDGWRVTIPEAARLMMRTVCAVFDRYLATGKGRHSRAV